MYWGLPPPDFCRLGLAYAGSNREDVLTLLLPVMGDSKSSMEVSRQCGSLKEGGREGVGVLLPSAINSGKDVCEGIWKCEQERGGGAGPDISSMKSFRLSV